MSIYETLRIYDAERNTRVEFDRIGYLQHCAKGNSILHVGCSDHPMTDQRLNDGNLLHQKLQQTSRKILGIDISREGVEKLRQRGFDNVIEMDAENIQLAEKFDCIIAGDVLEHMNNPGRFLASVGGLLNPGGELIVGVPSAFSANSLKVWAGKGETVHVDHTFYFSPKTLSALCSRYGLLPTRLRFTVQPKEVFESKMFVALRNRLISFIPAMAPSIIIHFKRAEEVDRTAYVEWK